MLYEADKHDEVIAAIDNSLVCAYLTKSAETMTQDVLKNIINMGLYYSKSTPTMYASYIKDFALNPIIDGNDPSLNDVGRLANKLSPNETKQVVSIEDVLNDFDSEEQLDVFIQSNSDDPIAASVKVYRDRVSNGEASDIVKSDLVEQQDDNWMQNIQSLPPELADEFFQSPDCQSVLGSYCELGQNGNIATAGQQGDKYIYKVLR